MCNKSATRNKMAGTRTAAWSQLLIQTAKPASGNVHPPSHQTGFSTAAFNYLSLRNTAGKQTYTHSSSSVHLKRRYFVSKPYVSFQIFPNSSLLVDHCSTRCHSMNIEGAVKLPGPLSVIHAKLEQ